MRAWCLSMRAEHIATGEGEVAGVEQEGDAGAGGGHEGVELRLGFDHGGHVVVIAERHALSGAPFAEGSDLFGVSFHLAVGKLRLSGERLAAIALDGTADFAVDDAWRVDGFE